MSTLFFLLFSLIFAYPGSIFYTVCSVPWLNGNLALAEKCSGPLRFRLRQVLLYKIQRAKKCVLKSICPRCLRGFCLSLSVGHFRRLQINIFRSVIISSLCYHLPSEYGTCSGGRSDVRKGTVSLIEYTPYFKHIIGTLTDVTAEIYWHNEYTVDRDS